MDLGLSGKRAAVGGASAGLGFACARALAEEGVEVALCGRDEARIQAAAERIGPRAIPLVADLSQREGARAFIEEAQHRLGGLDILIANSGGPPVGAALGAQLSRRSKATNSGRIL